MSKQTTVKLQKVSAHIVSIENLFHVQFRATYISQTTYKLDSSIFNVKWRKCIHKKAAITSLSHKTPTPCHLVFPPGVYYSPWESNCLGETIKVIAVFMRTDFQSALHCGVTFLLSTIQPFTHFVIIAAHLKRLFVCSISRCFSYIRPIRHFETVS